MTVYVDDWLQPARVRSGSRVHDSRWSHLYADSTDELIAFAVRLGLQPRWIQHRGRPTEHFDVTEPKRAQAIALGAVPVSWRHTGEFISAKLEAAEAEPAGE